MPAAKTVVANAVGAEKDSQAYVPYPATASLNPAVNLVILNEVFAVPCSDANRLAEALDKIGCWSMSSKPILLVPAIYV